jgi:hypothetical protein
MEEKIYPLFVTGVVCQVQRREKDELERINRKRVRDSLCTLLEDAQFLEQAPFKWINFIYLEGTENTFQKPRIGRISKKYFDLPLTVEIAAQWLEYASFNDEEMLEQIFEASALEALVVVGKKYKLPTEALEKRLQEIGGFPELPEDFYEKLPPSAWRAPKGVLPMYKKIDY